MEDSGVEVIYLPTLGEPEIIHNSKYRKHNINAYKSTGTGQYVRCSKTGAIKSRGEQYNLNIAKVNAYRILRFSKASEKEKWWADEFIKAVNLYEDGQSKFVNRKLTSMVMSINKSLCLRHKTEYK